jgi:hypothetical protein
MKVGPHHCLHFGLFDEVANQVLKKYPERTIAKDLLKELEAFEGDPSNILLSRASLLPHSVSKPALMVVWG